MILDFPIPTDQMLEHNSPYLVVVHKMHNIHYILNVASPFDLRIVKKEGGAKTYIQSTLVRNIPSIENEEDEDSANY